MAISIHAPREGGDSGTCPHWRDCCYFNPRPREGGDMAATAEGASAAVFQSTPPRGGRPFQDARPGAIFNFNPRPREGGDVVQRKMQDFPLAISSHAPARGATTGRR